jgi:hypothetical protein
MVFTPDTKQPYRWHGGEPGQVEREDLPYITEGGARTLVDEIIELLVRDFGYARAPERPRKRRKGNGEGADTENGAADWQYLYDNIREGRELHDSLRDLAAKLIASGMGAGAATNTLRAAMMSSAAPHNGRWKARYCEIPILVDSAVELLQEDGTSKASGNATGRRPTAQPTGPAICTEDLKAMTFTPIKYVVPDIIVEGLTLFAGKPKVGKSWLLLHTAIAVALGGSTLGDIHCDEGDVLYCALEDSPRRLQSRLGKLLGASQAWPSLSRLFYHFQLPRLADGGLDAIRDWIKSRPNPRLIVIDTLAMIRPPKKRDETNYDADYAAVLTLRDLANEFGIAVVLVHHLRKADADDAFDTVSGTLGLTGAPDSVLILRHNSGGQTVLHGKGRDMVEIEKAVEFDPITCMWRIIGDASDVRRSTERTTILDALRQATEPIGPHIIAAETGMRAPNVRRLLAKLAKEGVIERAGYGKYRLAEV